MLLKFILKTLGNLLTFLGIGIIMFTYTPIVYSEVDYFIKRDVYEIFNVAKTEKIVEESDKGPDSENITPFQPANPEFSIIINKIDINVPIVESVTTINRSEYMNALKHGVAHAKGTALPGEKGNTFLFAHSSLNFWELGEYATVFNLLNHVEVGDSVILYHDSEPYAYKVFKKEIVNGWNTAPFDVEYEESVVTLVTCYPPGSTVNRLVVKAKRI